MHTWLWLLTSSALGSSIYNPFDPIPGSPEPGAQASLNVAVELDRGNLERTQSKISGGVQAVTENSELKLIGSTHQAVTNDERTAGTNFLHARVTRDIGQSRVWWFGFSQVDNNVFKSVRLRNVNGLGLEFRAEPSEVISFNIATSVMSEITQFGEGVVDDDAGLRWRSSTLASVAVQLGERTSAGATVFYQPRLDAWLSNVRTMATSTLVVDLTPPPRAAVEGEPEPRRFATKVRFDVRVDHDSQPPPDIVGTDVGFDTSLVLSWK